MKDDDLLVLLDIIERVAYALYLSVESDSSSEDEYRKAYRMAQSFRENVHNRIIVKQGEV